MSDQQEFLDALTRCLHACDIPYMICGSLASSIHGEPRSTNDIDVIIAPTRDQLDEFLAGVPESWYVDDETARDALRTRGMFNVIDPATGWKADLIIIKNRPFSRMEFDRRESVDSWGLALHAASPEDVILSKLEWMKDSESERQYRDAIRVAIMQGEKLDRAYLTEWAPQLSVEGLLARLLKDVDSLPQ